MWWDEVYPTLSGVWYSALGGVAIEACRRGERISLNHGSRVVADYLVCYDVDSVPRTDGCQFGRSRIHGIRTAVPEAPQRY